MIYYFGSRASTCARDDVKEKGGGGKIYEPGKKIISLPVIYIVIKLK